MWWKVYLTIVNTDNTWEVFSFILGSHNIPNYSSSEIYYLACKNLAQDEAQRMILEDDNGTYLFPFALRVYVDHLEIAEGYN